jgi:DsbC/DsbD-like thiol-disulfide interchange protein
MIRRQIQFLTLLLLLVLAACSGKGPAPKPVAKLGQNSSVNFVKANAVETEIAARGSGEATVHMTVQSGYHVNANPPSFSYLRATELTLQPTDGITVGYITYPTAVSKKFAFAEGPLAVYEGEVAIKVLLKAGALAKGPHSIPGKLNVQACDDEVCYPPGSLDISIPVLIK